VTIIQATLLGLIQGLTEFLPISSTAHLILVPWLFNMQVDESARFAFDVLVQLGTLVAVVVYFVKDLWQIAQAMWVGIRVADPFGTEAARLGWLVIAATIPAAIIGVLLKDFFESLHQSPAIIAQILIFAAVLFAAEHFSKHERDLGALTWRDAILIGCTQALALLPGISRSAATLSGGLLLNLKRPAAAKFSFLMSIPIMLGASLLALKDLIDLPNTRALLPPLAIGFVVAAVVGFGSIHWLLGYLAKRSMDIFAWYRIGFGLLCLVVVYLRSSQP